MRLSRSVPLTLGLALGVTACSTSEPPARTVEAQPVVEPTWIACPNIAEDTSAVVPVMLAEDDQPPRPLRKARPEYPKAAFERRIEGTVLVAVQIDDEGRVVRATVKESVPALDQAAVNCACRWEFAPAMQQGRPVATVAELPMGFQTF